MRAISRAWAAQTTALPAAQAENVAQHHRGGADQQRGTQGDLETVPGRGGIAGCRRDAGAWPRHCVGTL